VTPRVVAVGLLLPLTASAHLMVAQHGTLNVAGDGAFVVLSLPASAFPWADDDHDGRLSAAEFQAHQPELNAAVLAGARLTDEHGALPLEGLLLGLSPDDEARAQPARQVMALGRFALAKPSSPMALTLTLFGDTPETQAEAITITRGRDSQLALFTPARTRQPLFPSSFVALADAFALGARHILEGADHLLFLLVVLAAGGGWRRVALTLTCFTLGHAATLALGVLGGVEVSSRLVEPAIALTIVAVALLDWRRRSRCDPSTSSARLALVFGCALIHGLALASGLRALGGDHRSVVAVLVGFNLGIEAGQLAVTALAAVLALAVLRGLGAKRVALAQQVASVLSIATGWVWFMQRIVEF
jgi:HupE / UreJ protein